MRSELVWKRSGVNWRTKLAARKCRSVVSNTSRVLACELLCAAQGLEFHKPLRPSKGVAAAYDCIRAHVRPLGRDRTLHRDLEAVERLIRSGSLLAAVEAACGPLDQGERPSRG